MRQILHIFQKDVRRLAAPLTVLVALQATFVVVEWRKSFEIASHSVSSLQFLLPFAWIFLITALVFQERLPGTSQYWLTRPIPWLRLMTAKLLFAGVFINATLFISDCALLAALHLPISVIDLLLRQIPLTILLFLPSFCLATITSGLGQVALALVISALGFVLEILFPSLLFSSEMRTSSGVSVDFGLMHSAWLILLLPALTLFIIVIQYTRRATLQGRILFLIPLFVLIPLIFMAMLSAGFPPMSKRLQSAVPDTDGAEKKLSFDFEAGRLPGASTRGGFVGLQLPIQIKGLPPGAYVEGSGLGKFPMPLNSLVASLYIDGAGYGLRFPLMEEQLKHIPSGADVTATIGISAFRVLKTQVVPLSDKTPFLLAASAYCRSGWPSDMPFLCWGGPRQVNQDYRAFLLLGKDWIQLNSSSDSVFQQHRLNWGLSPIDFWPLSLPVAGESRRPREITADTQAKFLTVEPLGMIQGKLDARGIELASYVVKP